MDAWLGAGVEPQEMERRTVLSRLINCSVTTSSAEGALRTRTAVVDQVGSSGRTLSVRLLGSGLYDDVIPNPRIVISGVPALGPYELVTINGLARIQSHLAASNGTELLVLDVTIQRMECWRGARVAMPVVVGAPALVPDIEPARLGPPALTLRQA